LPLEGTRGRASKNSSVNANSYRMSRRRWSTSIPRLLNSKSLSLF